MTGEEKARKLFDLQNFSVYWDRETLGDVEGQELVVRSTHRVLAEEGVAECYYAMV